MNYLGSVILGFICIGVVVVYHRVLVYRLNQLQAWLAVHEGLESGLQLITGPFNNDTLIHMQESIADKLETKYSFIGARCITAIGQDRSGRYAIYWTVYRHLPSKPYQRLSFDIRQSLLHYIFNDKGLHRIVKPTLSLVNYTETVAA